METTTVELPAAWASLIINGDDSGLEEAEIAKANREIEAYAHDGYVFVDVDIEHTYFGRYGSLMYEMVDYTIMER
jgi:hypothetical protein